MELPGAARFFWPVEVRIHAFFLLLLAMAIGLARSPGSSAGRMFSPSAPAFCSLSPCARSRCAAGCGVFGTGARGILLIAHWRPEHLPPRAKPLSALRASIERSHGRRRPASPTSGVRPILRRAGVVLASTPGINLSKA